MPERNDRISFTVVGESHYEHIHVQPTPLRRWFQRLPPWLPRLPELSRRAITLITLASIAAVLLLGTVLYVTGPLDPFARVATVVELPAAQTPAAYTRVAIDGAGWSWVAQSTPGLAAKHDDKTLLTVVNPNALFGSMVQVRLCLQCQQDAPPIGRIDDIAPVPGTAHSLYIAGWTTAADAASTPLVTRVDLRIDGGNCTSSAPCTTITALLDTATLILPIHADPPSAMPIPTRLIAGMLAIGVMPLLSLTAAPDGHLYCFLSDRGRVSFADKKYNLSGGVQDLLRYDPGTDGWNIVYQGPAGSVELQRVSPTATVTALAVDAQDRYLYLADADLHAILRMDVTDATLSRALPVVAAGLVTRFAGQPLVAAPLGTAEAQAIPGWQGDGGAATQARLGVMRGLALDRNGDLLVSDATNARIRLITPQGRIFTVAGGTAADGGAPAQFALRGLLGIAVDARNRIFVMQNATSGGTTAHLRVLDWGWIGPQDQPMIAKSAGQTTLGDSIMGLPTQLESQTMAGVITAGSCQHPQEHNATCVTNYMVAAGGPNLGQQVLASPGRSDSSQTLTADAPTTIAQANGSPVAVVATDTPPELTFIAPTGSHGTNTALVPLPAGTHATGIAIITPSTDAQVAALGAAYILVAVTGGPDSADLLIYKATTETCGLDTTNDQCAHFPGTPTLAATVPLVGTLQSDAMRSTGAVSAILSDDGTHAFALVAHPDDNQVSVIDLTTFMTTGTLPTVATQIAVTAPHAIAIRHDGLAAYIGAGDGQLAQITTVGWLDNGVPSPLPSTATSVNAIGGATDRTTALALSGDDAHLFAAVQTTSGATTIRNLGVGAFGAPSPLHNVGTFTADAHLLALALTPGDRQLLALSAPNGMAKDGTLRVWATTDPAAPDQWLTAPLSLGTVNTAAGAVGIMLIQR